MCENGLDLDLDRLAKLLAERLKQELEAPLPDSSKFIEERKKVGSIEKLTIEGAGMFEMRKERRGGSRKPHRFNFEDVGVGESFWLDMTQSQVMKYLSPFATASGREFVMRAQARNGAERSGGANTRVWRVR